MSRQVDWKDPRAKLALALIAMGVSLLWCWNSASGLRQQRRDYVRTVQHIEMMHADVERIEHLREAPRLATDRIKPNDELLSQIRAVMAKARVNDRHWVGNAPGRPQRVPDSMYERLSTRLTFEDLSIKALSEFMFLLLEEDASLSISYLRIFAPPGHTKATWNAEIVVSYLLYAPTSQSNL